MILHRGERFEEAVEAYEALAAALEGAEALELRARRTVALMNVVEALGALDRIGEAHAAHERLVEAVADDVHEIFGALAAEAGHGDEPAARISLAATLVKQGMVLVSLEREAEARSVFERLVERFRDDDLPDVRRAVRFAWQQLDELGGSDVL